MSKLDEFFKSKSPQVDKVKKNLQSKSKGKDPQLSPEELDRYIQYSRERAERGNLRKYLQTKVNQRFRTKEMGKVMWVWQTRSVRETLFMHIPRALFLSWTCWVIYKIKLNQEKENTHMHWSQSRRRRSVNQQIEEIGDLISVENNFDPNRKSVLNRENEPEEVYRHTDSDERVKKQISEFLDEYDNVN